MALAGGQKYWAQDGPGAVSKTNFAGANYAQYFFDQQISFFYDKEVLC
jgi:hypothetical protein